LLAAPQLSSAAAEQKLEDRHASVEGGKLDEEDFSPEARPCCPSPAAYVDDVDSWVLEDFIAYLQSNTISAYLLNRMYPL